MGRRGSACLPFKKFSVIPVSSTRRGRGGICVRFERAIAVVDRGRETLGVDVYEKRRVSAGRRWKCMVGLWGGWWGVEVEVEVEVM